MMSDWKRAGTVQFGSGVRCKEFTVNGAKCTVYCEGSDIDKVNLAFPHEIFNVEILRHEDEPSDLTETEGTKFSFSSDTPESFDNAGYEALTYTEIGKEPEKESSEDFKSKIQTLLGKK